MDNTNPALMERFNVPNVNGSARRSSPVPSPFSAGNRNCTSSPSTLAEHHTTSSQVVLVVVNRDESGYGMKVSGDNPVYVQSVKEGGAAEKAGLHAGDKIIKVNGVNVMSSKHPEVVNLIRSSSQVILTVQQRTPSKTPVTSPVSHNRSVTSPSTSRITGPQPVDHEKRYQLQLEKEQHYRLMIEKEQRYIDLLRSQLAAAYDEKKCAELTKTEKNLQTLQTMLLRSQSEQSPLSNNHDISLLSSLSQKNKVSDCGNDDATINTSNGNDVPPPLPKRNQKTTVNNNVNNRKTNNGKTKRTDSSSSTTNTNSMFNNEINSNLGQVGGVVGENQHKHHTKSPKKSFNNDDVQLIDNILYSDHPPPLPPRTTHPNALLPNTNEPDAVNSLNKQMSYPLVATHTALFNNYSPNPSHHRTKSSPESLLGLSPAEASKKLIASESLNELNRQDWNESPETPPGTPPPPYPRSPSARRHAFDNDGIECDENNVGYSSPDGCNMNSFRLVTSGTAIHAATPQVVQQPIISMEDDEISDQEMGQLEDHGYFKSLSRLWEHPTHLAVFMNYILSNSDPNSLLFYLLTDLYKEGNTKEMRKWAFEIHSCFLVPGAPLRLGNVDENIAIEIDGVLTNEFDKEEILRKIFWKARLKAKEELTKQLEEFQQKRTAGLGTMFGPTDQVLSEITNDKTKESKLYESLFLEKLEPYLEEVEKENYDPKRYYLAAALTTVLQRIFNIRPNSHSLMERCPTFVNKEKSFRTKLMGLYSKKLNLQGHQYIAQQYYTVIVCTNCHQVIYGIGPQGYQCSVCLINLHRQCVKLFDDTCPGPMNKNNRGISKFIRMNDHRRKNTPHSIHVEKERRQAEEKDNSFDINENGENKPSQPVSRSGSDRRPDVVREEQSKCQQQESSPSSSMGGDGADGEQQQKGDSTTNENTSSVHQSNGNKKKISSNINRSESVKEQSEKQRKQRRNISDPSHNTTSGNVELDQSGLSNTESGSSSNSSISYNGRLSESPSNSVDVTNAFTTTNHDNDKKKSSSDWESDTDVESNWQNLFPEEELRKLLPHQKKRQDVINEMFHTESTHVRNLRVLHEIFYKTLVENQVLKPDELSLIFPNIKEIMNVHIQFNREMKKKRREDRFVGELGDMLIGMFGGASGENLRRAAATFCERQQVALEFIKDRRKRDSKFETLLADCEKKRECRRLPLQAIIPMEMQRLSKYPLLLERLIGSTETDDSVVEELEKLRRAHHLSKEILNHVNEATKLAWNQMRLEEIQKHLDTTNFERSEHSIAQEFRTLDLTKHELVVEGNMQLRRPNKGIVPVHILLLEDAVVILHKEGDKYLLKFFQSGSSAQPMPLSPIIKMSTLLVRTNAVCKNALFLVNTSTNSSQMFDLLAEDDAKRDIWFKHFSDAAEAYNRREGKNKRHSQDSDDSETVQELPSAKDVAERAEAVGGTTDNDNATKDEHQTNDDSNDEQSDNNTAKDVSLSSDGGGGLQTKIIAEDWPLIQPSQVHVEVPPVHTAESRLTPLEQIRRKDEQVRKALEDKEGLVADLLSIPREHFQVIADMAGDEQNAHISKDLSERIAASIYQVDQLHLVVNEALNVSEAVAVAATGGKTPCCQSQELSSTMAQQAPSVSAHELKEVVNLLSAQLTDLLNDIKIVEEERDRLRKEVYLMRERLHEQHALHDPVVSNASASPPPEIQCDLDNNQENPNDVES